MILLCVIMYYLRRKSKKQCYCYLNSLWHRKYFICPTVFNAGKIMKVNSLHKTSNNFLFILFYFSIFQSLELVWANIIIMNCFCWFEQYRLFETALYSLKPHFRKIANLTFLLGSWMHAYFYLFWEFISKNVSYTSPPLNHFFF